MEPISQSFGKYYDRLVKNNLDEWKIDTNIGFQIREEGELRDVQWLSAGGQDLIGFCMHLALVDVMYREEKPFLLLDDPFVNLDESKTESAMQLLTEVAAEYQIIYFTCHESRTPFADRLERFEQNRA